LKALRNFLDNIKPRFEKGGKFEKFHSTFDAFETLLFVPNTTTKGGVHIRDAVDLKRTMAVVVMAVMPALLFGMWNVGYQHFLSVGQEASFWETFFFGFLKVFPIIVVSYVVGLGIEFGFAQWRGHDVNEGFLVTGMLIPLIVPVDTPLWMIAVATAFSVVIGKEVFGGTGMNIWNPALLTRAFLFFAYPSKMSGDKVWIAGLLDGGDKVVDGFSGATPLGQAITGQVNVSLWDSFIGTIPGSIGETSTLAILIGAVILLYTGVGSWKIMLSTFAGGYLMALVFHAIGTTTLMQIDPVMQLTLGGFAFGAVFMATDPVTATRTEKGKWIYGFLIGMFAIMIRVFNPAYPEGVMLAILLMNTFAPLIDHFVVQGNIKRRLKRAKVAA
jgi:Na+-transporting NADH:ubiquinone oxidoreductase subunit B